MYPRCERARLSGYRGKDQAVSCPFREMVADFFANKIGVTFYPHDVEGAGDEKWGAVYGDGPCVHVSWNGLGL